MNTDKTDQQTNILVILICDIRKSVALQTPWHIQNK